MIFVNVNDINYKTKFKPVYSLIQTSIIVEAETGISVNSLIIAGTKTVSPFETLNVSPSK